MKISWDQPAANGSPITGYKIEIQSSEPTVYVESLDHCDGSKPEVVALNYCLVPMQTFSEDPINLVQGQLIIVQLYAFNNIGLSDPSAPNQEGVDVQVSPPTAPSDLIVNFEETNETRISLIMSAFDSIAETGGS